MLRAPSNKVASAQPGNRRLRQGPKSNTAFGRSAVKGWHSRVARLPLLRSHRDRSNGVFLFRAVSRPGWRCSRTGGSYAHKRQTSPSLSSEQKCTDTVHTSRNSWRDSLGVLQSPNGSPHPGTRCDPYNIGVPGSPSLRHRVQESTNARRVCCQVRPQIRHAKSTANESLSREVGRLSDFIESNQIVVPNVAGPRESNQPGAYALLLRCFGSIGRNGKGRLLK